MKRKPEFQSITPTRLPFVLGFDHLKGITLRKDHHLLTRLWILVHNVMRSKGKQFFLAIQTLKTFRGFYRTIRDRLSQRTHSEI